MANAFSPSNYRFHDPVRYFKANDPYYWEVDNIPLKQLQENCNFLKDQVESILNTGTTQTGPTTSGTVYRSSFDELKPYVTGSDNKVKVRPGRYSARVNDAYTLQPLQFLRQVAGFNDIELNSWEFKTNIDSTLKSVLDKFKSSLAQDALNMNGLFERIFSYPMQTLDLPNNYLSSSTPFTLNRSFGENLYPNVVGKTITYNTQETAAINSVNESVERGLARILSMEGEFIKKWRGIARISIVDVPEEIEIEIPAFDSNDFYYIDESGNTQALASDQRIDLVFIYSKPVDASATTIAKFNNNIPTKITQPILGIVKGAGLGINLKQFTTGSPRSDIRITDSEGNPVILPSIADKNSTNSGFGSIKGSFPSPDDLMNITPLLSENLESNHLALIGQSILPVAYVVVKRDASLNSQSVPIITSSDLIDIRPFFRTAELSYNERSGLAAATPPVSIANPVVTEAYVDTVVRDLSTRISSISTGSSSSNQTPRIVHTGYIMGGLKWGVESVLVDYLRKNNTAGSFTTGQIRQLAQTLYDYPTQLTLNELPDWDMASWCFQGSYSGKGQQPHDYINFSFSKSVTTDNAASYGIGNSESTESTTYNDFASYPSLTTANGGSHSIHYVAKTIKIDRTQVPWMSDYRVNVKFHNCVPLSRATTYSNAATIAESIVKDAAQTANIWVSKKNVNGDLEFTIFVSWAMQDLGLDGGTTFFNNRRLILPNSNRALTDATYNGFAVITKDMMDQVRTGTTTQYGSKLGVALYPTVSFEVIGIPADFISPVNTFNPIITLK
jgi:hypothetical protein